MRIALALVALFAAACVKSNASTCGDLTCPSNTTCMAGNQCIDTDLVQACDGLVDGASCTVPGLPTDKCLGGICQASRCGDGRVTGREQCDGAVLGAHTCKTEGFYSDTGITCGADCKVDTTACVGRCGDGVKNGPELCDGTDMGTATCFDAGFYGKDTLHCKADCTFETSQCQGGHCGDGMINGLEECDGAAMNNQTCAGLGYKGPLSKLSCSSSCTFSSASCLCTSGRCKVGQTCVCGKTGCGCAN